MAKLKEDDLWTVQNPPLWMLNLPGLVASGPESLTFRWALRPDEAFVEFDTVDWQPDGTPVVRRHLAWIDCEQQTLRLQT